MKLKASCAGNSAKNRPSESFCTLQQSDSLEAYNTTEANHRKNESTVMNNMRKLIA